jgi:hypothetical protein
MNKSMIGTTVYNEQGVPFTVVGVGWASSAQGPIPTVELQWTDSKGTVGIPFDGFMNSFTPTPATPLVGTINADTVTVVNGDIDTLEM